MTKPNIILVMFDQMRYDCAGFAGNHEVRTPTMDRFAKEGCNFTNAYCPSPRRNTNAPPGPLTGASR